MKRIISLGVVFLIGIVISAFIIPVSANTNDLTITPGASGNWVSGGYDFAGTGYATKSGFQPFNQKTTISFVVWVKAAIDTGNTYVFSQYVGSEQRFDLILLSSGKYRLHIGVGTTNAFVDSAIVTSDKTYAIVGSWTSGDQINLWVNTSFTQSAGSLTGTTNASRDMTVGRIASGSTAYLIGQVFTFVIFSFELDASKAGYLSGAKDRYYSNASDIYLCNEGAGTTLFDNGWRDVQGTGFDVDTPGWQTTQSTIFTIFSPLKRSRLTA